MGYFEPDTYHQPEQYGLVGLGEIQWGEPSYNFDLTAVWRRSSDGQLFYADDSGCSCPSPFEDFRKVDDLTACTREELQAHLEERNKGWGDHPWGQESDIAELMARVVG